MRSKFTSTWKGLAVMVPGVLIIALAVYAVIHHGSNPERSSSRPQSGIIVSYTYLPISRRCGPNRVEAHVRLNSGEVVIAGSAQPAIVHSGMRVAVEMGNFICVAAPYAILREGPPNNSIQRTQTRYAGSRRLPRALGAT
jgi:hypothetical protein